MRVDVHRDWQSAGFELDPVAPDVGPFPHRAMLRAWWRIHGGEHLLLVEGPEAMIPLQQQGKVISFVGEPDLFDYHSPLGPGAVKAIAEWASGLPTGVTLDFDSMPAEAADTFMEGLEQAGLRPAASLHETSAIVALPTDYETYLAALDKKQRHEVRRKGRRFAEMLGTPRLERHSDELAVARFAAMHRRAEGRKGRFMTPEREAFFAALQAEVGGFVDFMFGETGEPVAAAYGFEDEAAYYLYNSAYDPDAAAASPGIVLVAELLRRAVGAGHSRFDFLKGDEVYKYRMGAEPRPLWRVAAEVAE